MVKLADMASNQPKPGARRGRKPANAGTAPAAAPAPAPAAEPEKPKARRGRPPKDRSQQQAPTPIEQAAGSQGATGAAVEAPEAVATAPAAPQSGEVVIPAPSSFEEVKIEVMSLPSRGGRKQGAERFPFGTLGVSTQDKEGTITGPSFFLYSIEDATYQSMLSTARKRHPSFVFHGRKVEEKGVKGMRIWKTAKS
jgi:hypothetical protein